MVQGQFFKTSWLCYVIFTLACVEIQIYKNQAYSIFFFLIALGLGCCVCASLLCGARASHCGGFSCCGAQALGTQASVVVAHRLSSCGSQALEHRLSSCGAWASLLRGMWDLPGPGLKPVSPALAGRLSTTAPPGKPKLIQS